VIIFSKNPKIAGFTIVELGVVIVVIGILATISVVGYGNWQQSVSSVQIKNDLSGAAAAMENSRTFGDVYPGDIPSTFTASNGVILSYFSGSDSNFCINGTSASDASIQYYINQDMISSGPQVGNCYADFCIDYPGFVAVPGSTTYGTSDFCVMKYEAKNDGSGNPISVAAGNPWNSISRNDAITEAQTVCSGCHLVTEAEWMTMAQNVLNVNENWSGGVVGSGYIYSGHNDSFPTSIQPASNDDNPYYGTNNSAPSNQKRTLIFSNGQVIWDLAGNLTEWTSSSIAGNNMPGLPTDISMGWKQWSDPALLMAGLPYNSQPSSTGISELTWAASSGVGQLYSMYGYPGSTQRSYGRGGSWPDGSRAGVLSLWFGSFTYSGSATTGFRVAVTPV
jgi:type II secretory pathway pseudopilin PulG